VPNASRASILLQTPDYARARIASVNPGIAEETLAGSVRTRMERRQVLSLPNPARFTFYIHEHALRFRVGTDGIMQEQLLHLVLTAALDNLLFGGLILEDSGYVNRYHQLVPVLADVALDEGQSSGFAADLADEYDRGSERGVADVLAKEQLQQRRGNQLRGGGVVEPPTPIYE
jgi:hypothetical protein